VYIEKKLSGTDVLTNSHKIIQIRLLTENTFVLRIERGDMQFKPGQHIIVGFRGELNQREYSVYSGEKDDYLEILVREVLDGTVSLKLKQCNPGQLLQVNGPFGSFGLENFDMFSRKLIFIASGTGIAPFHSFVKSYPGINYTLIHGVRIIMRHTKGMIMIPGVIFCVLQKRVTEVIEEESQVFTWLHGGPRICYFICAVTTV
jgi:hypothetical protein